MTREQIASSIAGKIRGAQAELARTRAVIGMDGFVDSIIDVVDQRRSFDSYQRVETIEVLGRKVLGAAGNSANYEFVVKRQKLGGNGPNYANALAVAGIDVDYIGSLGIPRPHEVFGEFGKRARLHSLCEPGYTDALEFSDGKLMLGKITHLSQVNWSTLLERIGLKAFTQMCQEASLLAMNNWTMLPGLGEIWSHVLEEVLPKLTGERRRVFIDLADPEKRTADDLRRDLAKLSGMQKYARVILGLNLKEAGQVAGVFGLAAPRDNNAEIRTAAEDVRKALGIEMVVVHPRRGAGAANGTGSTWMDGPLVQHPKLSTGAGDNFNAGFCLGLLAGGTLDEALAAGVATSGYYVREAASPDAHALVSFLENLPSPER